MKKLILIPAILSLVACSSMTTTSNAKPARTTVSGAGDLFISSGERSAPFYLIGSLDSFSALDYCELLKDYGLNSGDTCRTDITKIASNDFGYRRNEMQGHIMAVSDQKCGGYKKLLHGLKGDTDSFWGGLSTILAGAGAVVKHATSAKAFAAGAAVASGVRSEANQAYFANLTVEVLTAGINSRRSEIRDEIEEKKKSLKNSYSLNVAVADALRYHSACNAVTGLEVAAQSITRAKNPGAKELNSFFKDLGQDSMIFSITPKDNDN